MRSWPYPVEPYTHEEVQLFCAKDTTWQLYRLKLKGLPTERKLDKLYLRIQDSLVWESSTGMRRIYVQVNNYLNALKRGGFLDDNLRVLK